MSSPEAISYDPRSVPFGRRIRVRAAVAAARLLATRPPQRIRAVLTRLRRGARPATYAEASSARQAVVSVSLACAGREACLVRSLATALLCRSYGHWPTWCVGARRLAPFYAHAWVEVDGVMVGEDYPADYFRTFFTVA
ncbi:MAG TPA: lasso peptide biosynthesis B2 protein [Actinophytocola sp.]|uniref:lasso peptide biosynthesis B2 protein n=1 Tax=Actinophytocola sp. TaxID=1872138 RepID=UPI002DDD56A7|nr:lasso peptide biosynthesis B2 protein [Actinophytocola sp.]HEV2784068.1 lasso peptide biosynthesis B2 protein [Actinophytocola sp.]